MTAAANSGCFFPYVGYTFFFSFFLTQRFFVGGRRRGVAGGGGSRERSLVGMVGVLVTVEVWTLELFSQQLAETLGHRVLAAAQSQAVHLETQTHS